MKFLIIPDVHGRTFWKDVLPFVETNDYEKIIFLGDYVDPYSSEGITDEAAYQQFLKILELKEDNPDKIELLLGNHDLGYLDQDICECRTMYDHYNNMRNLITYNRTLFDISYKVETENKIILFSHAGFTKTFLSAMNECIHEDNYWFCIDTLNYWIHQGPSGKNYKNLLSLLGFVGRERGGFHPCGSCVWADIKETSAANPLENAIQIFGHTKLDYVPMYTSLDKTMSCIDSQRVFVFDTDTLELSELNKNVTEESTE